MMQTKSPLEISVTGIFLAVFFVMSVMFPLLSTPIFIRSNLPDYLVSGVGLITGMFVGSVYGLLTYSLDEIHVINDTTLHHIASSAVTISLGIIALIASFGIAFRKKWAWHTTVSIMLIELSSNTIGLILGAYVILPSFIFMALIVYWMFKPHVKEYFHNKIA